MNKTEILELVKVTDLRHLADSMEKISTTAFGLLVTSMRWHADRIEAGEFKEEFTEYIYQSGSKLSDCYKE